MSHAHVEAGISIKNAVVNKTILKSQEVMIKWQSEYLYMF